VTILALLLNSARERRMYRNLLQLDDHLLKDIGFNRMALREQLAMLKQPSADTRL
jgi:uncharacterized protein YjiS (DUF1127 family)